MKQQYLLFELCVMMIQYEDRICEYYEYMAEIMRASDHGLATMNMGGNISSQ